MTQSEAGAISILVCDDDTQRAGGWAAQLGEVLDPAAYKIEALSTGDFALAVADLHLRVQASKGGEEVVRDDKATKFDQADVVIIDSDLTPDLGSELRRGAAENLVINDHLVGEYGSNVAWLARNFSAAGILVVVNHIFKERTFDLTMQRFAELPADAYISAPDIDSRGLWFGEIDGSFRPWGWPNLVRLADDETAVSQLDNASDLLRSTVCQTLGVAADDVDAKHWELLQFDAEAPEEITLRDVAESVVFGVGRQADVRLSDSQSLRIARAGLRRWLDRVVLPAQSVFVDLPHLIQDRPWLVPSARGDSARMTELVADSWSDTALVLPEALAESVSRVVGRHVWFVDQLPAPQPGQGLREDDLVFCEDVSAFRPVGLAKEYSSDIEGAFRSRFVEQVAGVEYTPKRRLFV